MFHVSYVYSYPWETRDTQSSRIHFIPRCSTVPLVVKKFSNLELATKILKHYIKHKNCGFCIVYLFGFFGARKRGWVKSGNVFGCDAPRHRTTVSMLGVTTPVLLSRNMESVVSAKTSHICTRFRVSGQRRFFFISSSNENIILRYERAVCCQDPNKGFGNARDSKSKPPGTFRESKHIQPCRFSFFSQRTGQWSSYLYENWLTLSDMRFVRGMLDFTQSKYLANVYTCWRLKQPLTLNNASFPLGSSEQKILRRSSN